MRAFASGLGLGLLVASEVGPISLLCIRSVLRHQWLVGVAIGLGAAIIDVTYATLGVAGATQLLRVTALRVALGVIGACVLALLGAKTLVSAWRIRSGGETAGEVMSARSALMTSLAATASNPLTIASWAAVFTAATTAHVSRGTVATAEMLVGIGLGTFVWFTFLSTVVAATRRRIGRRGLQTVDVASGAGLLGFAGVLGWRTLRQHG